MKINSFLFSLALLSILCSFVYSEYNFQIKNEKIYDKQNRQIYFHGTNIVATRKPYIPRTDKYDQRTSYVAEDIALLKKNGFNAIRLGIIWSGAQPTKDYFNETYFQKMVEIVNKSGQAGIYTLVEFHQDVMSQVYCGDGTPNWLIHQIGGYKTFPFPLDKKFPIMNNGTPDRAHCYKHPQASYYFSYDTAKSFDKLYTPGTHFNNKFSKFWQKIAQYFKGNPYVIGYELINQPWVGNFYRNPTLLIPSMAQRMRLQRFYDDLSMKIRQIDPDTPICFSPVTFDNAVPTGFRHPPGGNRYRNQSIFCYHYYSPPEISLNAIHVNVKNAKKLHVPAIISQTYGNQSTLNQAQKYAQSWLYWIYKDFQYPPQQQEEQNPFKKNKGIPLHNMLTDIIQCYWVRSYMPIVAGQFIWSNFNATTGQFIATYWADPNGQSVMFINKERTYKNSYEITTVPKKDIEITQSKDEKQINYVKIKYLGREQIRVLISVIKV